VRCRTDDTLGVRYTNLTLTKAERRDDGVCIFHQPHGGVPTDSAYFGIHERQQVATLSNIVADP